jgi:hypothetical protein
MCLNIGQYFSLYILIILKNIFLTVRTRVMSERGLDSISAGTSQLQILHMLQRNRLKGSKGEAGGVGIEGCSYHLPSPEHFILLIIFLMLSQDLKR